MTAYWSSLFLQGVALLRIFGLPPKVQCFGPPEGGRHLDLLFFVVVDTFQHCFLGLQSLCFGFGRGRASFFTFGAIFVKKLLIFLLVFTVYSSLPSAIPLSPSQFTATPSTQLSRPNSWNHPGFFLPSHSTCKPTSKSHQLYFQIFWTLSL